MPATLTMLTGKHAGRTVPLSSTHEVVFGRNDDCNVRLRTDQVSRHHCVIEYCKPDWIVRDLGSSNGTFVNGVRVMGPATLANGNRLSVGPIQFQFAVEKERAPEPEIDEDADSGVIAGWLAEDDGGSPIKKTTVLTDAQRAALQSLSSPPPKPPQAGSAQPAVPDEALSALRKMKRNP